MDWNIFLNKKMFQMKADIWISSDLIFKPPVWPDPDGTGGSCKTLSLYVDMYIFGPFIGTP